jgi:hypothetical protein
MVVITIKALPLLLVAKKIPVWYVAPYLLQMLHYPNTDPSFIIFICKRELKPRKPQNPNLKVKKHPDIP